MMKINWIGIYTDERWMKDRMLSAKILALLLVGTASAAPPFCSVRNAHVVDHMPAARTQLSSDFCYAYSAVALLAQLKCSTSGCTSADEPSVLDAMIQQEPHDGIRGVHAGGQSAWVLNGVAKSSSIARESCAPLEPVMLSSERNYPRACPEVSQKPLVNKIYWRNVLSHFYSCYRAHANVPCPDGADRATTYAKGLKALLDLSTSLAEIKGALNRTNPVDFLDLALVPEKCERAENRIKLPEFVTTVYAPRGPEMPARQELKAQLSARLTQQIPRPVQVNLCAHLDPSCADHALVVSGEREACCGKICKTEYRIYDSDKTFKAPPPRQELWVSEDELLPRIEYRIRRQHGYGDFSPIVFSSIEAVGK